MKVRFRHWFTGLIIFSITMGIGSLLTVSVSAQQTVFINEIHYDNTGTDVGEAVEIAGPAGTDLTGWSVVRYNGSTGAVYGTDTLSGTIPNQQGGYGTVAISYPTNGLQNGAPDGIALVDVSSTVVQFLSYEGTFTATNGPAAGMTSIDIGVSESSSTPAGNSLQLIGTGSFDDDFVWAGAMPQTFGAPNTGQTFQGPPNILINEVDSDTPSTDTLEFVELYDGGIGNTNLTGLVVVFFNGNGDASYNSFDLDGFSTDADGYFLLGNAGVSPAPDIVFPSNGLQNGADAVAVYEGNAVDFPNGTAVTTTNLIDALVYDTNDSDDAGLLVLLNASQPQVNEGGAGDKDNHSNQRCPNGEGGARNSDGFIQGSPSAGSANNCPPPPPPPGDIIINEIDYDQPFADASEFVELKNTSASAINLDAYSIVLVNGSGGGSSIYRTFDLPNTSLASGDYFVLCGNAANVANCDLDVSPNTNLIQNGAPDAVALVLDTTIVDTVSYEGDTGAPYTEGSGVGLLDPGTGADIIQKGISRFPDGIDTNQNNVDFSVRCITPGGENISENTNCEPAIPLTIMEIQGAGHKSPYLGDKVQTTGVVTIVRPISFYIQDPTGDGDDATSDGIMVFVGTGHSISVGDFVLVTGQVTEFYPGGFATGNLSITEIGNPTTNVLSNANPVPAATVIGTGGRVPPSEIIDNDSTGDVELTPVFDPAEDGIDFYESLEGMVVQVNDARVVGGTSNFGEIVIIGDDGANAGLYTARGGLRIRPTDFNPERIHIDDAIVSSEPDVNVGDRFSGPVIGVMEYSFGNFKLLNSEPLPSVIPGGLLPESASPSHPSELSVATLNVENLDPFDSAAKFDGLASQIIGNLRSPDIIGLQEIQDNSGTTDDGTVSASDTYAALIDAIQDAGGPLYDFREIAPLDKTDGGQPGANIRVGFLFRADRVTFVDRPGGNAITATGVTTGASGVELTFSPGRIDPTNAAFFETRKSLVGEFEFGGSKVFVVVNHFKSKGDDDDLFGRVQPPVLYTETLRIQQAQVVNDFVDDILALDSDASVLVLGDMNDFQFSPTLSTLAGGVLTNLVDTAPANDQYTFLFEGNSQVLDNYLVSSAANGFLEYFDIVHTNAEFAADDRFTDHDPLLARFCMDITPPEIEIDLTPDSLWPPNHKYVEVLASVVVSDNLDPDPLLELVSVVSSEADNGLGDGDKKNDIVIIDDFTFKLRAERAGGGEGRIYTVTFKVTDHCGNVTIAEAQVTVPHSQGKGK